MEIWPDEASVMSCVGVIRSFLEDTLDSILSALVVEDVAGSDSGFSFFVVTRLLRQLFRLLLCDEAPSFGLKRDITHDYMK